VGMNYHFLLPFILMLFFGCAKFNYYTEQIIHQAKIQWSARDNQAVLNDPDISDEVKHRIKLVGEYKKYFYEFFDEEKTGIYSKTTMLEDKAVSYLLIASPHTKIEPHEFKFPFVGSFPYIGFSKLNSARIFAKNLEEQENLVTWIRPVYAYSTLGYLEDRILSSFFHYDDVELAELVFHELFHTIFFIKNEVELNENLANLYGKEMLKAHFKDRPELMSYISNQKKVEGLNKRIVELIEMLKEEFNKLGVFLTNDKADELTQHFIAEVFKPEIVAYCQRVELPAANCKIRDDWNQASFAAFMTYEKKQDFLEDLMAAQKLELKEFLGWLRAEYKTYKSTKKTADFAEFLRLKVDYASVAVD
jgi:predicted aminopeptidase